mmetsp:Transcript_1630/g.3751  ORF Transcript_1630/g.3751 Transcript_1630/m.3751 type:complete len:436 (+) Transcript_1630:1766-3073(+)
MRPRLKELLLQRVHLIAQSLQLRLLPLLVLARLSLEHVAELRVRHLRKVLLLGLLSLHLGQAALHEPVEEPVELVPDRFAVVRGWEEQHRVEAGEEEVGTALVACVRVDGLHHADGVREVGLQPRRLHAVLAEGLVVEGDLVLERGGRLQPALPLNRIEVDGVEHRLQLQVDEAAAQGHPRLEPRLGEDDGVDQADRPQLDVAVEDAPGEVDEDPVPGAGAEHLREDRLERLGVLVRHRAEELQGHDGRLVVRPRQGEHQRREGVEAVAESLRRVRAEVLHPEADVDELIECLHRFPLDLPDTAGVDDRGQVPRAADLKPQRHPPLISRPEHGTEFLDHPRLRVRALPQPCDNLLDLRARLLRCFVLRVADHLPLLLGREHLAHVVLRLRLVDSLVRLQILLELGVDASLAGHRRVVRRGLGLLPRPRSEHRWGH